MPFEKILRIGMLVFVFFLGLWSLKKRDRQVRTQILLFFGPWVYFAQYVGVVLSPAKLLAILFLFTEFMVGKFQAIIFKNPVRMFLPLWQYSILLTLVMAPFWPQSPGEATQLFYSASGRWLTQLLNMLLGLSLVVVVYRAARIPGKSRELLGIIAFSCFVTSLIGIYIWYAQKSGLPYPGLTRMGGIHGGDQRIIKTYIDGVLKVRAYSFSGEPKGLAAIAALGIAVLFFCRSVLFGREISKYMASVMIIFMALALYLTYSTAGYIMLPIFILAGVLVVIRMGMLNRRFMTIAFLIFAISLIGLNSQDFSQMSPVHVFEERVTNRVEESGFYTYAEEGVISLWKDKPSFLLLGAGLGGSTFYIRQYTIKYAGFVAAPRGIIGFVAGVGLVGLVLFILPVMKCFGILIRHVLARRKGWEDVAGVVVFGMIGVAMVFTYSHWYLIWVVIGMLTGTVALVKTQSYDTGIKRQG